MYHIKKIVLLTLTFSALIQANNGDTTGNSTQTCFSIPQVQETISDVKKCLKIIVNTQFGTNENTDNNTLTNCSVGELSDKYDTFVNTVNSSCFGDIDTVTFARSNKIFFKLLETSLININSFGPLQAANDNTTENSIQKCLSIPHVNNTVYSFKNSLNLLFITQMGNMNRNENITLSKNESNADNEGHNDTLTNHTFEGVSDVYNLFVIAVNSSCRDIIDTVSFTRSNQIFIKFLETSLNNTIGGSEVKLVDATQNSIKKCLSIPEVNKTFTDVIDCLKFTKNTPIGYDVHVVNSILSQYETHAEIESTSKNCTVEEMRDKYKTFSTVIKSCSGIVDKNSMGIFKIITSLMEHNTSLNKSNATDTSIQNNNYGIQNNKTEENPLRNCFSDPQVAKTINDVKKCFKINIATQIRNNTVKKCTVKELSDKYNLFLNSVSSACFEFIDTETFTKSNKIFLKLLTTSLYNNTIGDLYKTGGLKCVKSVMNNITQCITDSYLGNVTFPETPNHHLWRISLIFDQRACDFTKGTMSVCVNDILKRKCTGPSESSVKYVNSLFKVLLSNCSTTPTTDGSDSVTPASYVSLVVTTTMALILSL